ncbi:MAG: hypothetical protein ACYC35_14915 [Pirellulales bacterium]
MSPNGIGFRLLNRLLKRCSNLVFRPILRTKPVRTDPTSDNVLFTLLDRRNVNAYILAAKSFLRFTPEVCLHVQSDGSLTASCARRLAYHFPGIIVSDAEASLRFIHEHASRDLLAVLPPFEITVYFKLVYVMLRFGGKNVIQMDSDILLIRRPDYVLEWMAGRGGDCFHSDGGNRLADRFHKIGFSCSKVRVSRFNSGFFGLRQRLPPDSLVPILQRMRESDPELITTWEAEQGVWAVLLNSLDSVVCLDDLARDYVGSGWRTHAYLQEHSTVVHFVGTTRFRDLIYLRMAREVIHQLRSQYA